MSKIIERIARDLGIPDILSRLVDALPATDLQSLLLEVYRQRAARHRLLRTQSYNDPHSIPHFSIFSLCSAGQDEGNLRFESAALVHHISIYLHALTAFLGADTPLQLELTDFHPTGRQAQLAEAVITPLRQRFPQLVWSWDNTRESGRGYYVDLCFHINATNRAGEVLQLADGGVVDWTQRLLSNARERCCISGLGSERLCTAF